MEHLGVRLVPCAGYGRSTSTVAPRTSGYLGRGALAVRDDAAEISVTDVACELFDATHGGIDYRYGRVLAYLAERLKSESRP